MHKGRYFLFAVILTIGAPIPLFLLTRESGFLFYAILLPAFGALFLTAVVINIIAVHKTKYRYFDTVKYKQELLDKKELVRKNGKALESGKTKLKVISFFYMLFLWLFSVALNTSLLHLLSSIPEEYSALIAVAGISAGVLVILECVIAYRCVVRPPEMRGPCYLLRQDEYKAIWEIVTRAAKTAGFHSPLFVMAVPGCSAGITFLAGHFELYLGIEFLNISRAEELYTVCLHEFAHISNRDVIKRRRNVSFSGRWEYRITGNMLLTFLFRPLGAKIVKFMEEYELIKSYGAEIAADRQITQPADKAAFLSAVAKMDMYAINAFELNRNNVYELEKRPENIYAYIRERFLKRYNERKADWESICLNQLPAKIDTHPNLAERMKNIGEESFTVVFDFPTDTLFCAEIKSLTEKLYSIEIEGVDYEKEKKENYTVYKHRAERYEQLAAAEKAGSSTGPDALFEAAYAYYVLNDYDNALKLFKALYEIENNNAIVAFYIGRILAACYDDGCIPYLLESVRSFMQFQSSAMALGFYLQYRGLAEEKERLKPLIEEFTDEHINIFLSCRNAPRAHTLSPEALAAVKGFLKGNLCVRHAFLVSRTVNKKTYNYLHAVFANITEQQMDEFYTGLYTHTYKAAKDLIFIPIDDPKLFKKLLRKQEFVLDVGALWGGA